jgi:ubiquinone/menaquinone biosynthesis C-methylase UbiE
MLSLTRRGLNLLATLRKILNAAGEFAWRSDNQRWVIADETDYDQALDLVFPDSNRNTAEYLNRLGLRIGMNILEIGAGTGKTTVDAGLCRLVGSHGSVVAFDRSVVFLRRLAEKCRQRDIQNVQCLQGMAENLPFPDNSFDASIDAHTLHFTDAPQVVAEMARVTKPGGFISALSPPPEFDMREIPMLASLFRPLAKTVAQTGLPFGEHNGLARGLLKELFERHTVNTEVWNAHFTWSAEDHLSYLTLMLKTEAYLQNFLCRLPFHERWSIIRRLENEGINIARETSREDKLGVGFLEAALGRIPANKPYKSL